MEEVEEPCTGKHVEENKDGRISGGGKSGSRWRRITRKEGAKESEAVEGVEEPYTRKEVENKNARISGRD